MKDTIYKWQCGRNSKFGFSIFQLFLGAYGGQCYTSRTKIKCTDEFKGEPLTLESDIKKCRRPVKIGFKLDIFGLILNKEYEGDEDIPLPELPLPGIFLNVKANPLDSGDLQLKVRS